MNPVWTKADAIRMAETAADSSMAAVGGEIGLTRERVRQIITKHVDPLMVKWLRIKGRPKKKSYKQKARDKIYSNVKRNDETGCLDWLGYRAPNGYGRTSYMGEQIFTHRLAWTLAHGEIPDTDDHYGTMCVCHKCDNPSCVNPDHLFLGTMADNVEDRDSKFRGRGGTKAHAALVSKAKFLRACGLTAPQIAERIDRSIGWVYKFWNI